MKRFFLFLRSEKNFLLTHKVILMVALLQPALMYMLMGLVFIEPTFDLKVSPPQTSMESHFIDAIQRVGIQSGVPYINPVIVEREDTELVRQYINMESAGDQLIVNQAFGKIDSNLVKNLRNRVTAAALIYWQDELGDKAILLEEHPLLPHDVPFIAYFGLALIPMGIFLSAGITTAIISTYDFETGTILEIRMAPRPGWQQMLVQFIRIIAIGLLSAGINIISVGIISGVWPQQVLALVFPFSLLALIGGCVGMFAAFITRKALPAFLITLVVSMLNWLFGDAFGLSSGFSGWYETLSTFAPNHYLVEIMFPSYYNLQAGSIQTAIIVLASIAVIFGTGMILFRRNYFKGEIQ
jgi:hypothetical protein